MQSRTDANNQPIGEWPAGSRSALHALQRASKHGSMSTHAWPAQERVPWGSNVARSTYRHPFRAGALILTAQGTSDHVTPAPLLGFTNDAQYECVLQSIYGALYANLTSPSSGIRTFFLRKATHRYLYIEIANWTDTGPAAAPGGGYAAPKNAQLPLGGGLCS